MAKNRDHPPDAEPAPTEVSASDLKNGWHEYLDRVSSVREEIVVTRYGKPIARLSPIAAPRSGTGIFGWVSGGVSVQTDLVSPIGETWDADE